MICFTSIARLLRFVNRLSKKDIDIKELITQPLRHGAAVTPPLAQGRLGFGADFHVGVSCRAAKGAGAAQWRLGDCFFSEFY